MQPTIRARSDPKMPASSDPQPRQPSFLRTVAMVLSAFVGIRKRQSAEAAHAVVKPAHVVVAGILCALLFIAILVSIVRFIIPR